jgi:hypothetical protein
MKKFSSIEQFRHVVKSVQLYFERTGRPSEVPTLHFTGTTKLHGTNAGIRRSTSGKIQAQSREQIISPTCDNYGFAAFVESLPNKELNELFDKIGGCQDTTIYGEWIGKGIQDTVAACELERQWVIVGAWVNEEYVPNNVAWRIDEFNIFNILDIDTYKIIIDFKNPGDAIEELEALTKRVEEQCPWSYSFGVKGIGEGIVWTCDERPYDSDLWFKTKGSKHSGKNKDKKKIATVDPQKVENIEKCIDIILTEGRLNQGLEHLKENHLDFEMKNMGKYLKWVGQDTQKEEMDTVEANDLEWKDVAKLVTTRAKKFFMDKYNEF